MHTAANVVDALVRTADHPQGVRQILLADPLDRNALVETLRTQVHEALEEAYADSAVRAIVICAARTNFSVGGDLTHVAGREAGQSSYIMMNTVADVALAVRTGRSDSWNFRQAGSHSRSHHATMRRATPSRSATVSSYATSSIGVGSTTRQWSMRRR